MNLGKSKLLLTTMAVISCLLATGPTRAGASAAAPATAAPDARPDVVALRQERLKVLREARDIAERLYSSGTGGYEQVERIDRMLVDAEIAVAKTPTQLTEILENAIKRAKTQENISQKRLDAGTATALDPLEAKAYRLSLEVQLKLREDEGVDAQHR